MAERRGRVDSRPGLISAQLRQKKEGKKSLEYSWNKMGSVCIMISSLYFLEIEILIIIFWKLALILQLRILS
jgi:hypothetical protein